MLICIQAPDSIADAVTFFEELDSILIAGLGEDEGNCNTLEILR